MMALIPLNPIGSVLAQLHPVSEDSFCAADHGRERGSIGHRGLGAAGRASIRGGRGEDDGRLCNAGRNALLHLLSAVPSR